MSVRAYVARLYGLRRAFRALFLEANGKPKPDAQVVLQELRRFCYGNRPALKASPNGLDPYATVAAAARQEVYFRITEMLHLDDSDLVALEKRAQIEEPNA
jgi:hypothetical protein